jgi:chromosome segregation ATPase
VSDLSQSPTEPQQPRESEEVGGVTSQADSPDPTSSTELSGVVEHINAILKSAEAAADAIRAEAAAKADETRRAAVEEGQKHLSQAVEDAARIRSEAEEWVREAEQAAERNREAEQQLEQRLAQAEADARARRQAEEDAERRIEALREREEKLKAYVRPLETTLRRALEGFQGISSQLEELIDDGPALGDETLVEALNEPVRRTGEREETVEPQERPSG